VGQICQLQHRLMLDLIERGRSNYVGLSNGHGNGSQIWSSLRILFIRGNYEFMEFAYKFAIKVWVIGCDV
jgi:hypothetical protein